MTRQATTEYAVGAIVLAFAGLALWLTAASNRMDGPVQDGLVQMSATFGRVDGVDEGTEVRFAGMPVGQVIAARLVEGNRVDVTMAVSPDVPVPVDSAAIIETNGLFGSKYIEIQPGGEFDTISPGGRLSFSQDSVIIEDLVAAIVDQAKAERGLNEE